MSEPTADKLNKAVGKPVEVGEAQRAARAEEHGLAIDVTMAGGLGLTSAAGEPRPPDPRSDLLHTAPHKPGRGLGGVQRAQLLQLQHAQGNRAVARMMATSNHSSLERAQIEPQQDHDIHEQAAPEHAQTAPPLVIQRIVAPSAPGVTNSTPIPAVQRDNWFTRGARAVGGAIVSGARRVGEMAGEGALWAFERALGAAGLPVSTIMGFLRNAGGALMSIVRDPGAFLGNLINAVKGGFLRFKDNAATHLQGGLVSWLTGALGSSGIRLPAALDTRGVFSLALQVLNVTAEAIRGKVTRLIGAQNMQRVERVWSVVSTFISGGVEGLWNQVQQYLGNLHEMVVDEIKSWAITQIIQRAVMHVVSMFNPAGALVQIARVIYNVVMFLREQGSRLMGVFQTVAGSLSAIANGNIGGAVSGIERTLANLLPAAMDLLARLVGLGGIGGKIREIIGRVRQPLDRAIDRALAAIMRGVRGLLAHARGGEQAYRGDTDHRSDAQKKNDVERGLSEADQLLADKKLAVDQITRKLGVIKRRYRMSKLELVTDKVEATKETVHVVGVINPSGKTASHDRDKWPPKPIVIKSVVGKPQKRAGYEGLLLPGVKVGLKGWERAHSQGAGTGSESARGILYAPREVNQELQNKGIEQFIRNLYKEKPSNVEFLFTTETQAHAGTERLASIVYKLEARKDGKKPILVLEAWIDVENKTDKPKVTFGVGEYGIGFQAFLSQAMGE